MGFKYLYNLALDNGRKSGRCVHRRRSRARLFGGVLSLSGWRSRGRAYSLLLRSGRACSLSLLGGKVSVRVSG